MTTFVRQDQIRQISKVSDLSYSGADLTEVTVWRTAARSVKISHSSFSYTGTNLVEVVKTRYKNDGIAIEAVITTTLQYDASDNLESVEVERVKA